MTTKNPVAKTKKQTLLSCQLAIIISTQHNYISFKGKVFQGLLRMNIWLKKFLSASSIADIGYAEPVFSISYKCLRTCGFSKSALHGQ